MNVTTETYREEDEAFEEACHQQPHPYVHYDYWHDKWAGERWCDFTDQQFMNQIVEVAGFRLRANGFSQLSSATIDTNMQQGQVAMAYANLADIHRCLYFEACQKIRWDCPPRWKPFVEETYTRYVDSLLPTVRLAQVEAKYTAAYAVAVQLIYKHVEHEVHMVIPPAEAQPLGPPPQLTQDSLVPCWKHGKMRRLKHMSEYPVGSKHYQCGGKMRCNKGWGWDPK